MARKNERNWLDWRFIADSIWNDREGFFFLMNLGTRLTSCQELCCCVDVKLCPFMRVIEQRRVVAAFQELTLPPQCRPVNDIRVLAVIRSKFEEKDLNATRWQNIKIWQYSAERMVRSSKVWVISPLQCSHRIGPFNSCFVKRARGFRISWAVHVMPPFLIHILNRYPAVEKTEIQVIHKLTQKLVRVDLKPSEQGCAPLLILPRLHGVHHVIWQHFLGLKRPGRNSMSWGKSSPSSQGGEEQEYREKTLPNPLNSRAVVLIPGFLGSPIQDGGRDFSACSLIRLICRLGVCLKLTLSWSSFCSSKLLCLGCSERVISTSQARHKDNYSQLFLKRTPSGPKLLSGLERCPL